MARFLNRVRLENFKSIAHCDVDLKDLTFLVGPNGAGKSNFMNAISIFTYYGHLSVLDSKILNINSDEFIRKGFEYTSLSFYGYLGQIDVTSKRGTNFTYTSKLKNKPWQMLSVIGFAVRINSDTFRKPIEQEYETIISSDGSNLANVLFTLKMRDEKSFHVINRYIHKIVPEIDAVRILEAGGYNILQFDFLGNDVPFNASQMSDGTLHALGVLTAIFHAKSADLPIIGIEDPEAGLHPAAARVMREALIEASKDVQIIVTSHSPDLLDSPDIDPDSILAVVRENGETKIGPIDAASRQALKEHLFTAGELLRMNQLEPAA